ncbi:MAG: ribonuclease Z [Chloroflexota bacterium]
MIDVILLGTSGTIPLPDRPLSALLARIGPDMMLFDCGEGTQVGMRRASWGFKNLATICISHLHADHVAGLPGILLTVANAGRTEPLDIYGPVHTGIVVAGLRVLAPRLPYKVRIHEIGATRCTLPNGLTLSTLPLDHSAPCLAYRLDLGRTRPFLPGRARELGVPVEDWKRLQRGEPVAVNGRTVQPDEVLGAARRGLSLAYVTDTRPTPDMPRFLADADLLVIEGTYGDPADAQSAVENQHLLFSEAAQIGKAANVRRIWLTHFSARMHDPWQFAVHATSIVPATTVGYQGLTVQLHFDDDGPAPADGAALTR